MRKYRSHLFIAVLVALVAIQFVPVRKDNPPVTREIRWDSEETAAVARRACYDCHSNETTWPWYTSFAPVSWRIAGHVEEGRGKLNFSAWDEPNENLDEVVEVLEEREMPLWDYILVHSGARLSDDEYDRLLAGVRATFAADPPIERRRGAPQSEAAPQAAPDSAEAPVVE
jgi:hypothetical protein